MALFSSKLRVKVNKELKQTNLMQALSMFYVVYPPLLQVLTDLG